MAATKKGTKRKRSAPKAKQRVATASKGALTATDKRVLRTAVSKDKAFAAQLEAACTANDRSAIVMLLGQAGVHGRPTVHLIRVGTHCPSPCVEIGHFCVCP